MKAEDVVETIKLFKKADVNVWLDGGWGVDALLGKQTREHEDLDIVVQEKDLPQLRKLLEARGYKDVPRGDTSAWNFVLGDNAGRLIDIHAFTVDDEGNGFYGNKGLTYPAKSFQGQGKVNGFSVKCITAGQIVKFHTGYNPPEKHIKDIKALCKRFSIVLPPEYR